MEKQSQFEKQEQKAQGHFATAQPSSQGALSFPPPGQKDPARLQKAANQSAQVQQLKALQKGANAGAIQRKKVFKDAEGDYATGTGTEEMDEYFEDKNGKQKRINATNSLNFTKDASLPTPYKVIADTFGAKNVNSKAFKVTKYESFDRPRSVSGNLKGPSFKDREDPITTAIGHLGGDELFLRENVQESHYDGGHLIGAKILGEEAERPYNLAPQEADSNRNSYNNTIEQAARNTPKGTTFGYDVQLQYNQNNFSVDQQTLVDRKVLNNLHSDKPWLVYIPTRIPQVWTTNAHLNSTSKNFPPINNKTTKRTKASDKEVNGVEPVLDGKHGGGAFHFSGSNSKDMHFHLRQYVPVDSTPYAKPKSFKKEHSLDKPNEFEDSLPDKNEILDKLPGMEKAIKDQAGKLLKVFTGHKSNKFLDTKNLPSSDFPLAKNDFLEYLDQEEKALEDLVSKVSKKVDVLSKLKKIRLNRLFETAWRKTSKDFSCDFKAHMEGIDPQIERLNYQKGCLERMEKGEQHKREDLEKMEEEVLQKSYKDAQNSERWLSLIQSKAVEKDMDDFWKNRELLQKFTLDSDKQSQLLLNWFKELKNRSIQNATTSAPKKLLRELNVEPRRSNRSKKRKQMDEKPVTSDFSKTKKKKKNHSGKKILGIK